MAKKKKKKEHRQTIGLKPPSWDSQSHLHGLVHEHDYNTITAINKNTVILLGDEWENNIKENLDLWKKHIALNKALGLGKNKCTIGVGSGQSLNKNIDVLKHYINKDGVKPWDDRDFLVIAANHQLKPLLEINVIPDFVLLVDASDVVYEQLCRDIPEKAKHVQLIAGLHSSPKVLHEWDKQGRGLVFFLNPAPRCKDAFQKYTKKNPVLHSIDLGGNVLNGAFMVGITRFHSNVFCGVGNDLSFSIKDTLEEQRKSYYADGDYSSNAPKTGTGRDEANTTKKWAGFTLNRKRIITPGKPLGRYNIELDVVGSNATLWVYKTWIEITILGQCQHHTSFHYYNCSEGGILGVMCKERNPKDMMDASNWFMLDGIAKNKVTGATMYHTAMLEDFLPFFSEQRRQFLCSAAQTNQRREAMSVVQPVTGLEALV